MLRVDEAATRISLAEGQSKISLGVENITGRTTLAQITLELLDPHDKIVARTHRRETLKAGAGVVAAFLPISNITRGGEDLQQLLWYRLRYRIAAHGTDAMHLAASVPHEGIISLSEITPDLFELRVAAASKVNEGQLYRVRVRATHPLTSRPVRGVEVAAEVVFDETVDDETDAAKKSGALKLNGTTGRDGYATLDFALPARIKTEEGEIKVTARRGDVVQTASDDISLNRATRIMLTSDKPLYQPGQVLHLRTLLLNHATRRALAEHEATLEIEDPEGTTVFTAPLKTSRYGIASCDWPIPDNTRLGDYTVSVEPDDSDTNDEADYLRVKISRYELPNFSVSASPDRGYYLPGESAQVEVRGDYLFGQPLKRGHVRLVRETEREWNYKEQKYDIKEGDKYEGELGSDGRFLARINLTGDHAELAGNSWQRFADLNYAAYITDPTTNRTEQRRFRLRVTKEAIHIYVARDNYRQAAGLPLVFFVSTSYADGTPASCEVKLAHTSTERRSGQVPRSIRTNAYGIAKVSGTILDEDESRSFSILLTAHDHAGRTGQHVEEIWTSTDPVIRIDTDKTIYRAGESVSARISTNEENLKIFVDVISNNRVVETRTLKISGGSAQFELPYRPQYQNRVMLSAYATNIPDSVYEDYPRGTRTVVFPRNRELKFDVRMSQASYQPGEEASAGVRVRNAEGQSVRSALGVVVFDKAVEERARTEQDFGSSYGFSNYFYQFWYGLESIGGISARDIEQLNPARPLPEGLDTVAELILQRGDEYYRPNFFASSDGSKSQSEVFASLAAVQLKATKDALFASNAGKTGQHPANEVELRRVLADSGIALEDLRDPWGTRYQPFFSIERDLDVLVFRSAGADKKPGTDDDWNAERIAWHYFNASGEKINRALNEYHTRTGGFIRDFATLKSELARTGFDLDNLRDRWGKPYGFAFEVNGTHYLLRVVSGGADGRLISTTPNYSSDDFVIWTGLTDYFSETRVLIDAALASYLKLTRDFPRDETTLKAALRRAQLDFESLRDPWQRPYYANFHTETRYVDRVQVERGGNSAGQQSTSGRTTLTPVTQKAEFITLRSAGADGKVGTFDDFSVADFSRIISNQTAQDAKPVPASAVTTFSGSTGAIGGTVVDPSDAVVPGATVKATHQQQPERVFETTTGDDGTYLLRNLPAGLYTVRVDSPGFSTTTITDVQVQSSTLATVNVALQVGSVSETVSVMAGANAVDSTDNKSQSVITRQVAELPGRMAAQKPPISTPRLRKDFPETLYWQPSVETDARGRTDIRFKLADNITTWKMSIIGSTETGELGTIEREIRAFQPFFVEHDPPRVLTEGDEISLPVVLRNYLERAQPVALDIKPEDWFTLLGPAHKQSNVAAGDATRETFDFRAVASVKEGLQRITAIGSDGSDQIEKPVHVHPDGEEVAETSTHLLRGSSVLEANLPATAIQRSARAELKIYPNLLAHAIEGVEAIMSRPYGCAEQTISSTYPSLLVLRHYRRAKGDDDALPPVAARASRYVRQGYERLLSYRSPGGGFSYWGRGEPDLALTAYAVRFLTDAREFTNVDETVLNEAREWLIGRQQANGSWAAYEWDKKENGRRTAMLTAYVARLLAMHKPAAQLQIDPKTKVQTAPTPSLASSPATPLRRALAYLAPRTEEIDEPYLIASYALAAIDGGEATDVIARATSKLRALAHDEAGGAYWSLETNTPFYGWGQAGRIETTALAVQALSRAKESGGEPADEQVRMKDEKKIDSAPASKSPSSQLTSEELVDRGLLFLLRNKDRYGVWLSTQATVNVLDALDVLSTNRAPGVQGNRSADVASSPINPGGGQKAEVFVNGQSAGTVTLPSAHEPANPISLDLSRFLVPGSNRVEVRRAPGDASLAASAQLVTTYYRSWANADADGTHLRPADTRSLRLDVNFDRTTATTGDTVTCRVEAERIGHRGYGMLLAEVGLPPGADVDRASLERAMQESGWEFSHYDVLPDRLVAYLWPRAGGTKFAFTFRPRFGLSAKSAPSLVYDYYNPEARAVIAPAKFLVRDQPKPTAPAQAGRE